MWVRHLRWSERTKVLFFVEIVLPLTLVALAGAFLVVECFISLRHVLDGVYETTPFERYWPYL